MLSLREILTQASQKSSERGRSARCEQLPRTVGEKLLSESPGPMMLLIRLLRFLHASQLKNIASWDPAARLCIWDQVLLARWKSRQVAVKVLRHDSVDVTNSAGLEEEFRQEAQMLQDMQHPFVLEFLGACVDSKPVRSWNRDIGLLNMLCEAIMRN